MDTPGIGETTLVAAILGGDGALAVVEGAGGRGASPVKGAPGERRVGCRIGPGGRLRQPSRCGRDERGAPTQQGAPSYALVAVKVQPSGQGCLPGPTAARCSRRRNRNITPLTVEDDVPESGAARPH
jgi:hypothetical protein